MTKRKLNQRMVLMLCAFITTLLLSESSFAQNAALRKITGSVLDAKTSQGISTATILIKGSTRGAATDDKGNFSIEVADGNVLEISHLGYAAREVTITSATNNINIELDQSQNNMDEVVVVGYGSQKKKVVTGAVSSVKGGALESNHTISTLDALQGQAPGVYVSSTSGQPGDAPKIVIRGKGTTGDANPLYVVDGMPTTDISYLNPADIESMDILKDAASSAIYGTQAANGVVLVTTKRGKAGKKSLTFDAFYGWQNPARKLGLLNAKEYAIIMNEAAINSGRGPYYFYSQKQIDTMGAGTDWQKAATVKNAATQNYNLTYSGGNDQSVFSTALSYQKQQGVIGLPGKSFYERIGFRINSEHKVYKDIIKVGENLTYTHSNQNGIGTGNIYGNSMRAILNASPVFPVYNADGTYGRSWQASEANPIAVMDVSYNNQTVYDRIFGNLYGEVTIVNGLKFRSDFGVDLSYNTYQKFTPVYNLSSNFVNSSTIAAQEMYKNYTWNWDNTLTWQKTFGLHNVNVVVGTSAKEYSLFNVKGSGTNITTIADFDHAILTNITQGTAKVSGTAGSPYSLNSYFGRVNYNYNEKYLLTAIVRQDGSSRFGANNKWAIFPSVSAGWVVTNEDFFKTKAINFLKVRANWGRNGNDRIPDFKALSTLTTTNLGYYFGGVDNTVISTGAAPAAIPNPNLKWETSEQTDIGFDMTFLKHFNFNFDFYNKKTKDWLVQVPVPDLVGTGAPFINGGGVVNKGVELALNYQNKIGEVTFNVGGNIAFNKNNVSSVATADGIIHGANNVLSSTTPEFYRVQAGHPIGFFWGYKTAGIFQNEKEVADYTGKNGLIQPNAKPGDVRFADLNKDGVLDDKDKTQIGSPIPTNTYGVNLSAAYKGFDLSIQLSGAGGYQVVDGVRAIDAFYNNYSTDILNRWTGEGTSNKLPRVTMGDELNKNWGNFSDLYVHNASFMRVKSINLGYDLKRLMKNVPMQQCRLYMSVLNLYTFTHYRGIDPEIGYGNTEADNNVWSSGIDIGRYPTPRTILVGLNVRL
jgi:TonB-linked SusC/RagA family outer membrane protein